MMDFDQTAQERLAFAGLTPEIRGLLPELFQVLESEIPAILDRFYANLARWPALKLLLSGSGKVGTLKPLIDRLSSILAALQPQHLGPGPHALRSRRGEAKLRAT